MNKLDDRIPIPPKDTMNIGLTAVLEATMLKKFGPPGRTDPKCGDPSPKMSKRMLFGVKIGPMKVSGLDFAVHSLQQIFAEVERDLPDVFKAVKTDGMLCVRFRRGNSGLLSNHAWGTAIDLFFGKDSVPRGTRRTHRGNFLLFPFFNRHGWYWGAEFSGDGVDSMHFELAEETILKL